LNGATLLVDLELNGDYGKLTLPTIKRTNGVGLEPYAVCHSPKPLARR